MSTSFLRTTIRQAQCPMMVLERTCTSTSMVSFSVVLVCALTSALTSAALTSLSALALILPVKPYCWVRLVRWCGSSRRPEVDVVNEHHSGVDLARHALTARFALRPNRSSQAEVGIVGQCYRFFFSLHAEKRHHRAQELVTERGVAGAMSVRMVACMNQPGRSMRLPPDSSLGPRYRAVSTWLWPSNRRQW